MENFTADNAREIYAPPRVEYKIPLVIHQKHNSYRVPIGMANAIQRIIDLNPAFEHHYYDDEAMYAYVEKYGSADYKRAFHKIPTICVFPYKAFEADLFRYLLLQREGGIWADADCFIKEPFLSNIQPDDEFMLLYENRSIVIIQWMMAYMPNHPIVSVCLDDAVNRVLELKKVYSPGDLCKAVGPPALERSIHKFIPNVDYDGVAKVTFEFENKTFTCRFIEKSYGITQSYHGYRDDLKLMKINYWNTDKPDSKMNLLYLRWFLMRIGVHKILRFIGVYKILRFK